MNKLRTAIALLTSGSWSQFRQRWHIHFRSRRLRRAAGQPFRYRLAEFEFVCVPGIADSVDLFLTRDADIFELSLLARWLEADDAFVDIGANLGLYTFCLYQRLRGQGHFLAIEGSPALGENLAASAALLGLTGIVIEHAAVGDAEKDIVFYVAPSGKPTGEQSIHPDPERAGDYVPHTVRMKTLTTIAERGLSARHPHAVKLDIEGAEILALRGAPSAWFAAEGPLWVVEVNPTALARFDSTCRTLVDFFPDANFENWLVPQFAKSGARHLPLRPLSPTEPFTDAWFYNLIAIPRASSFSARRQRIANFIDS